MSWNNKTRRTVLKGIGAGAAGTGLLGTASAQAAEKGDFVVGVTNGKAKGLAKRKANSVKHDLDFGKQGGAVAGNFPEQALKGLLDILPALKREDSFVGRRAVPRPPKATSSPRVVSTGFVRYTSALKRGYGVFARPRWTRYPLVPYPIPPEPRRPTTGHPPTVGTWTDTGRAIDRTPPMRVECNREWGVFCCAVAPSCARSLPTVSSDGEGYCEDGGRASTTYSSPGLPVVGVEPSVSAGSNPVSSD